LLKWQSKTYIYDFHVYKSWLQELAIPSSHQKAPIYHVHLSHCTVFTLFNYLDSNTHKFVCYYGINTIPYKFALLSSHVPNDKLLPVTGCSTIYSCITTKADHLSECHQIVFIFPSRLPDGMVHHCPCVLFKAPGKHCCGSNKKIKMKCYEITKNLTIFTTLHSNLVVVADSIGVLCACLHYSFKFKVRK